LISDYKTAFLALYLAVAATKCLWATFLACNNFLSYLLQALTLLIYLANLTLRMASSLANYSFLLVNLLYSFYKLDFKLAAASFALLSSKS
jgi:hypothetical protein